jgi:hypothetical protein
VLGQVSFDLPPGEHLLQGWHAGLRNPELRSETLDVAPTGGPRVLTLQD